MRNPPISLTGISPWTDDTRHIPRQETNVQRRWCPKTGSAPTCGVILGEQAALGVLFNASLTLCCNSLFRTSQLLAAMN